MEKKLSLKTVEKTHAHTHTNLVNKKANRREQEFNVVHFDPFEHSMLRDGLFNDAMQTLGSHYQDTRKSNAEMLEVLVWIFADNPEHPFNFALCIPQNFDLHSSYKETVHTVFG